MNADQLDRLGRLADKADNFTHASKLPMPDSIHKQALTDGMNDIRDALRLLYIEVSGENPWVS